MKIDRVKLAGLVDTIADENLEIVSERNILHFANMVKENINNVAEDYFNEVYLTELENIKDDVQHSLRFSHLINGYRAKMSQWVEDNPIKIEDYVPPALNNSNAVKYSGATAGAGGIVTIALVFGNYTTVGLTTALITAFASYRMFRKGKEKDLDKYESELARAKQRYLDGVKKAMGRWIDDLEKFSEEVLGKLKEA